MHFQLARIHEINAHLRALMDPEKGMQSMNLAIRTTTNFPTNEDDPAIKRIKEQNKLLTEVMIAKFLLEITSLITYQWLKLSEKLMGQETFCPHNKQLYFDIYYQNRVFHSVKLFQKWYFAEIFLFIL